MALLPSQKNEIFHAIQNNGMDPREFEWAADIDPPVDVDVLKHLPSGYWFRFSETGGRRVSRYMPGLDREVVDSTPATWDRQLSGVHLWLRALQREVTAPDLWAELRQQRELLGESGSLEAVENTPFTLEEQAQIARQLDEVKAYVQQTHQLTETQFKELEAQLDYLKDAAARVPRLDWRNALIGALLGAVVRAALPAEPVRDALQMILRGLGQAFGHGIPALPL